MEHYQAKVSECLIFEDSYTGVLASKQAGIEVVNIYDSYADVEREKIDSITDYQIACYRDFINFVESVSQLTPKKRRKCYEKTKV